MNFHIITLFKNVFDSYLGESIIAKAKSGGLIDFKFYNPRDFSRDKFKRVDGRPYGGGPGMVMQVEPVLLAAKAANAVTQSDKKTEKKNKTKIIFFSPSGKLFDNTYGRKLAKNYKNIIFICGRYEGVDARVKKILRAEEISIGNYTLTGGELPAMVMIDAISRQIKGVLGNEESIEENRVSSPEVYTRPEIFEWQGKKYKVPRVLLTGHHAKIEKWKTGMAGKAPNKKNNPLPNTISTQDNKENIACLPKS